MENQRDSGRTNILAIVLAVAIGTSIFSAGFMYPSLASTIASGSTSTESLTSKEFAPQDEIDIDKIIPKALSSTELGTAKGIALANEGVQPLIADRNIEFMGYDQNGNVYAIPIVWQPAVHFNVANQTIVSALIDLEKGTVVKMEQYPIVRLQTNARSFADDYYTGPQTVWGLYLHATAPTYNPNSANTFTAFLVNGVKTGSDVTRLCTATLFPNTYWGQIGFYFDPTFGGSIVYTYTRNSCVAIQSQVVPYTAGSNYRFRMWADSTAQEWILFMSKIATGESTTVHIFAGSPYTYLTNVSNTSIFFENTNTNNTWDNQFATDPSGSKYLRKAGSTTWWGWDGNTQSEFDCNGPHPDTVISPNSGNPATYDVSVLADNYPAC